jgi:hypothetical protein
MNRYLKIETVNMIYQFQAMYRITSLHYFSGIAVAKVIYLSNLMSLCNIVSQWYHVRFVWWADIGLKFDDVTHHQFISQFGLRCFYFDEIYLSLI